MAGDQSQCKYSRRHLQFTRLKFTSHAGTGSDMQYKQFTVRVVVDSQQQTVPAVDIKPRSTPTADPKEKQIWSDKAINTHTGTLEFTAAANPQGKIGFSRTRAIEKARTNEIIQNKSAITQKKLDGVVSWVFDIDDRKEQDHGTEMLGDRLPFVDFAYTNVFGDPSENMNLVVASYWSKIPAPVSAKGRTAWRPSQGFRNIFSKPAGNAPAPSHTNLCKVVSMKTTPSHLPVNSRYCATVRANPEGPVYETVVTRQTDNSVEVTPRVIPGTRLCSLVDLNLHNETNIYRCGASRVTTPNIPSTLGDSRKARKNFGYQ